jgi:hypothetical protein
VCNRGHREAMGVTEAIAVPRTTLAAAATVAVRVPLQATAVAAVVRTALPATVAAATVVAVTVEATAVAAVGVDIHRVAAVVDVRPVVVGAAAIRPAGITKQLESRAVQTRQDRQLDVK